MIGYAVPALRFNTNRVHVYLAQLLQHWARARCVQVRLLCVRESQTYFRLPDVHDCTCTVKYRQSAPSRESAPPWFYSQGKKIVWQNATKFVRCENLRVLRSHLVCFYVELEGKLGTDWLHNVQCLYKVRVVWPTDRNPPPQGGHERTRWWGALAVHVWTYSHWALWPHASARVCSLSVAVYPRSIKKV